ncbi:MAG TPA: hypothetical protein VLH08_04195 [Acidobacteriota bacterium]|nr:hypothetical protein [Acidobacteriota bacterium]
MVRKYNQQFDGSHEHAPPVDSIPGVGATVAVQHVPEKKKSKVLQVIILLVLLAIAGIYFYLNRHRLLPLITSKNRTSSLIDTMIERDESISILV